MKKILRTKLEYRCEKSREFNYGLCDWYTRYSRSYDMIVSASSKEECQRVMESFEDKIRYYGIQESFESNLDAEYDAKKKLWVGLVEIWIDNNSVTEDKELIKGIYKEWKDELKDEKKDKEDEEKQIVREIKRRTTTQDVLDDEVYECYKCGEIDAPLFSIYVEFKDGTDYSEIIGSDYTPEEVEEYIVNLIEDNKWKDEVVDSGYGEYCPYCLNSLN